MREIRTDGRSIDRTGPTQVTGKATDIHRLQAVQPLLVLWVPESWMDAGTENQFIYSRFVITPRGRNTTCGQKSQMR